MPGVEVRLFAEADHLDLQHRVNDFLRKNNVKYIGHCYIADGLDKPYNLSLVYRQKRWWENLLGL